MLLTEFFRFLDEGLDLVIRQTLWRLDIELTITSRKDNPRIKIILGLSSLE